MKGSKSGKCPNSFSDLSSKDIPRKRERERERERLRKRKRERERVKDRFHARLVLHSG